MFLVQLFVSSYSRLVLWKTAMGFLRLTLRFQKGKRGFLTAVMEENCQTINDLRKLSFDEFNYREDLSSNNELVFVKIA